MEIITNLSKSNFDVQTHAQNDSNKLFPHLRLIRATPERGEGVAPPVPGVVATAGAHTQIRPPQACHKHGVLLSGSVQNQTEWSTQDGVYRMS